MKNKISILACAALILTVNSCIKTDSNQEMLDLIVKARHDFATPLNSFSSQAKLPYMDSLLALPNSTPEKTIQRKFIKAKVLLELGKEDEAIRVFEEALKEADGIQSDIPFRDIGIAYLRQGERINCFIGHEAESCLLPIRGLGIHSNKIGSTSAIGYYTDMMKRDPNDLESRWLLNVAYMTLGEYPSKVPKEYLLPGLEGDTTVKVQPFQDIAGGTGLALNNMAGGTIVDDFDNDGYMDIISSSMDLEESMHFQRNNADGTFTDLSIKSGLANHHGGLNMVQADYDNDGDKDILVLRGAWKAKYGCEPNSLLQNQGDGTFIDVTTISGLLSFHPTQTATWNDFNNDGWLDVFIGNESTPAGGDHPCELYMSNGNGTFRNVAQKAYCDYSLFVKGVTSGDYNNDGWADLFLSTMSGQRLLLENHGDAKGEVIFDNVSEVAGLGKEKGHSFPTWFWDYNNDGWLDMFACDYTFEKSLAYYAAAEKLGIPAGNKSKMLLYRNNKNGTFTNISNEIGLDKVVFAMGSNFGDIDNDGFLDMYLGSGNPEYQSLVPNKMFKNLGGEKFADVTTSARVGHLQKGHGVAFSDMDNDGDQDIYIDMGGAFLGDAYQSCFFLNPGQGNNNWIKIDLTGTKSNKGAIGSRVKVTFNDNGVTRSVYRDVNSGGSFGASPLRREIGIGQGKVIDEIEIQWHGSKTVQRLKNVQPNQCIRITEGKDAIEVVPLKQLQWTINDPLCIPESLLASGSK